MDVTVVVGLFSQRRGRVEADDRGQHVLVSLAGLTARRDNTAVWRRVALPAACLAAVAEPLPEALPRMPSRPL